MVQDSPVIPGLNFTAVDVETANSHRGSICSIGLVRVRGGEVVDTWASLVRPHPEFEDFHEKNVDIHGISAADVANERTWDQVYLDMVKFIGADDLVAHSGFDRSAVSQATTIYDLDELENPWYDSEKFARSLLTLASYRLRAVSRYLGLSEFDHHVAVEDAAQCAALVAALARRSESRSLEQLAAAAEAQARGQGWGTRTPGDFTGLSSSEPLTGERVVFTGALRMMKRPEAKSLVQRLGGTCQSEVGKTTTLVVSGDFDPTTLRPGTSISKKLEKARQFAEGGQPLEILTEEDFFDRVEIERVALEEAIREWHDPLISVHEL